MAAPHDEDVSEDPEAAFLVSLWGHLEAALEVATAADVLARLNEVLGECEAAASEIRRWRQRLD